MINMFSVHNHKVNSGIARRPLLNDFYHFAGLLFLSIIVFGSLAGCGTKIGTRKIGFEPAFKQINTNAINDRAISASSKKVLHRYNLTSAYRTDPKEALEILEQEISRDNRRDLLFALAELNYHAAGTETRNKQISFFEESRQYYLNAAIFAYFYLFEPGLDRPVSSYERSFRWACDFYNISLAKALSNESGHLDLLANYRLLPSGKAVVVSFDQNRYPWNPQSGEGVVIPADKLEVFGLSHRNRQAGIGIPFIVVKELDTMLPVRRSYPGTLFMKIEGSLEEYLSGGLIGKLVLYSPLNETAVSISGSKIPLEMDMSVQIAHTLNQQLLWRVGLKEFFTGKNRFETGLYKIVPYTPEKIPIVFVHGTFSNPIAWAEMCNTLFADPLIRNHYQFWLYLYDSNNPVNISALYFRNTLKEEVLAIDPERKDKALNQMVVIGHSQGGLLTKLAATDTKDTIIRELTGTGLDELDISEESRLLIKRTAIFEPLPFVKRIIFISTPHRGSKLVTGWVQSLVRKVVSLPSKVISTTSEVMAALPEENIPEKWRYEKSFTSIDSMSPDNPALLALSRIPVAEGIKSHSIIAVLGDGDPSLGSDGVVTYKSAHLDYVDSEYIVQPCGHSSQWHPLAIEEVRRILHLHVKK